MDTRKHCKLHQKDNMRTILVREAESILYSHRAWAKKDGVKNNTACLEVDIWLWDKESDLHSLTGRKIKFKGHVYTVAAVYFNRIRLRRKGS